MYFFFALSFLEKKNKSLCVMDIEKKKHETTEKNEEEEKKKLER
jgi:hypothetical protein